MRGEGDCGAWGQNSPPGAGYGVAGGRVEK